MTKNYKFTQPWFDAAIPTWNQLFNQHINVNKRTITSVLEIGCFEGKATTYLADNWLEEGTVYDVVDTFGGSESESGMKEIMDRLKTEDFIYHNFVHNISFHPNIKWSINRGLSQVTLPILYGEGKTYDLIYVDASHQSDDTFVDAYYSHKMLNEGGILIFDDFGWHDPENNHVNHSPAFGISAFVELYSDYYNLLFQGYQVGLYKKTTKEYEDDMLARKWQADQNVIKGTFS